MFTIEQLQSMKDTFKGSICCLEKDIAVLDLHIKDAYEKAEKGDKNGEFFFGVLNDLRNERRKLKKLLKNFVGIQKGIKRSIYEHVESESENK